MIDFILGFFEAVAVVVIFLILPLLVIGLAGDGFKNTRDK